MRAHLRLYQLMREYTNKNWYYYSMSEKSKRIGVYLYIIGLVVGFMFVQNALNLKSVDVATKEVAKSEPEVKKVNVNLEVKVGDASKSYAYELTDSENVFDLLQRARKAGAIYFESTEYSSGIDLDFISYTFSVFLDGNNITNTLDKTNLIDGKTYTLRLIPIRTEELR